MTTWRGMNAATGRWITDQDHIRQSIRLVLFTPLGSRVQRRGFGSPLSTLIDQPLDSVVRMKLMGIAATILPAQEPRIQLTQVQVISGDLGGAGALEISTRLRNGQPANFSIPVQSS